MKPIHKIPLMWAIACICICIYRLAGWIVCLALGFQGDWISQLLLGIASVNGLLAAMLFVILTTMHDEP